MSRSTPDSGYSIAAVSKLTGVSCHALRVWERRYGFPVPQRTDSGHRRYGFEQVRALQRIADRLRDGEAIGDLIAEIRGAGLEADREAEGTADPCQVIDPAVVGLVDRLFAGDMAGSEDWYDRLGARLGVEELVEQVIEPGLIEAGERWFRQECAIFQERVATGFLRRKLETLIDSGRRRGPEPSRTILVGTVQGDRHAGGTLILQLLMERAGWRVLNLGVDLPVAEYREAVERWRPDALGLSFVLSRNINKRFQELQRIEGLPIFVGGRSILNYQGLARNYGLIPVPGPITTAIGDLLEGYERWGRGESAGPPVEGGTPR